MSYQIGAYDQRAIYDFAYKHVQSRIDMLPVNDPQRFTINTGGKILSSGYLRSEIKLDASVSTYIFGINKNDTYQGQPQYPSEQRLNQQDSFYISSVGYFLNVRRSSGNNTDYGSQLFTHPPGQLANATDNINTWEALWNADLQIKVNNTIYNPAWDVQRQYCTPQTQYPLFGNYDPNQQYPVNDERDGATSGYFPMQPLLLMDGSYENIFTLTFKEPINNITIAPDMRMVLYLRGILCNNISKLMVPGFITP